MRAPTITRAALLPLLSTALVLPPGAAAADLHVTTTGTGNCTSSALGCTLTTALATASTGDRILVHAGVYRINAQVPDGAPGVEITAAPGEARPVLDVSGGTIWLTHGTDLSDVDVTTTSGTAIVAAGGTLDRVRVGVSGAGATGITLAAGALLRNSSVTATATGSTGVHVSAGPGRGTIIGSTLVASGAGASAANVSPDSASGQATLRAVNTIFFGSDGALDLRVASGQGLSATAVLHHCATSPARQAVLGDGSWIDQADATLTAAPVFVNRATGDLRQDNFSPTIDAGTADVNSDGVVDSADTALMGPLDLDGNARELGVPDIGADEHSLPPMILSSSVGFTGSTATAQLTVQPNGQTTTVSADWSVNGGTFNPSQAVTVSGSAPVSVSLQLGTVPAAGRILTARFHASNRIGATQSDDLTTDVPASALGITGNVSIGPSGGGTTTTKPKTTTVSTGALPSLLSPKAYQFSAQHTFRLECRHTVTCSGSAVLTRIGGVRTASFKIPHGQVRSITFTLTAAQRSHVRDRHGLGLRGLLELQADNGASSFSAVHLFGRRPH